MELRLTNTADPGDLPESVVGNYTGDALGTNRTLLSLYSALPMEAATVDGKRISMRSGTEAGWIVNSTQLGIPAGGTVTIVADFAGELDPGSGYALTLRPQPIVVPERRTVEVASTDGDVLVRESGIADGPERLLDQPAGGEE